METIYTVEQQNVIEQSINFIRHSTDNILTIKGNAGTGKTTVVKAILDNVKQKYKCVVSATSHKAKTVINIKSGVEGKTIQSLLGLMPNFDLKTFNPTKLSFEFLMRPSILSYDVIIIDEASMINKFLYEYLNKNFKTKKIIFIGDDLQLPPIHETISPVFTNPINVLELKTIIRQENDNPFFKYFDLLRNDAKYKTVNFVNEIIKEKEHFINDVGFAVLKKQQFLEKLLEYYYSTEYQYNTDFVKYLAYTNSSVKSWNNYIRKQLIKSDDYISIKDKLLGYKTIYSGDIILLTNSEEYNITNLNLNSNNAFDFEIFNLTLNSSSTELDTFINIINPINKDFVKLLLSRYDDAICMGGRAWRTFYDFKNKFLLLDDFKNNQNKTIIPKDIDFNYAITIHKSQGSTYKNCFINLNDILRCNKNDLGKLLYVACTRFTNSNYFLWD